MPVSGHSLLNVVPTGATAGGGIAEGRQGPELVVVWQDDPGLDLHFDCGWSLSALFFALGVFTPSLNDQRDVQGLLGSPAPASG